MDAVRKPRPRKPGGFSTLIPSDEKSYAHALFTPNEQYSHVPSWRLLTVPLIISGDLARLDDFTLSLYRCKFPK